MVMGRVLPILSAPYCVILCEFTFLCVSPRLLSPSGGVFCLSKKSKFAVVIHWHEELFHERITAQWNERELFFMLKVQNRIGNIIYREFLMSDSIEFCSFKDGTNHLTITNHFNWWYHFATPGDEVCSSAAKAFANASKCHSVLRTAIIINSEMRIARMSISSQKASVFCIALDSPDMANAGRPIQSRAASPGLLHHKTRTIACLINHASAMITVE